ncbi:Gfo/Idh/MocA family protein [Singulisphaera sp. PoT]|uniref:Gfo/Idh/MocA family protein n=1 Tax=Singulisphaera sp. PoT TaxID=3411797 RepID=UPI003BF51181
MTGHTDRRDFLKRMGGSVAAMAAASPRAFGANERMVVAVIGCGGMGSNHLKLLSRRDDVDLAYVCDVDRSHLAEAGKKAESAGRNPKLVQDLRKVLDDKAVDAVWVATPDHWHGPAAILACEAGKHVYVEKPCSHNIREGRLMVEASRKHKRVIQVGMQSRSTDFIREGIQRLREGEIGEVLVAKAWNSQKRSNIGHAQPSEAPPELDYDLWTGPAPMVPYQSNRSHYNWHWWYAFGTGDMGNDGVHELDIARWGLGVDTPPAKVAAIGGKYGFDDDQQFPDTQYVVFDFPGDGQVGHKKQLVFEQRIWSPYPEHGAENGNAFYGTKGMMILAKNEGWTILKGKSRKGSVSVPDHHQNFLDSIRDGTKPNGDIEHGHRSASLCHLGNLAARLGRTLEYDGKAEAVTSEPDGARLVSREYREGHWAIPKGV